MTEECDEEPVCDPMTEECEEGPVATIYDDDECL
jgi:hypothetical protein